MRKKILSLLLTFMVVVGLFVGCGDKAKKKKMKRPQITQQMVAFQRQMEILREKLQV